MKLAFPIQWGRKTVDRPQSYILPVNLRGERGFYGRHAHEHLTTGWMDLVSDPETDFRDFLVTDVSEID